MKKDKWNYLASQHNVIDDIREFDKYKDQLIKEEKAKTSLNMQLLDLYYLRKILLEQYNRILIDTEENNLRVRLLNNGPFKYTLMMKTKIILNTIINPIKIDLIEPKIDKVNIKIGKQKSR